MGERMESLEIIDIPRLHDATMLLALTGWMDGGAVSTGTLRVVMEGHTVRQIARIEPDPFYIYNFPGSMEVTALFRPEVKIKRGLIRELDMPVNTFLCDERANIVFFLGKEPNLRWQEFADAIFEVVRRVGVNRIIFIGSFGGTVPHTREPRMYGSVSAKHLRSVLDKFDVRLSDYTGPASFSVYLLAQAASHGIDMISFVAEIPGYLQGVNPLSIEAVSRRVAKFLNVQVDVDAMRETSNAWESQVSELVAKDEDLAATVKKLEEAYDNELIEEQESGEK